MLRLMQSIMNIIIGLISALWSHYFDNIPNEYYYFLNTLPPRCKWPINTPGSAFDVAVTIVYISINYVITLYLIYNH